MQKAGELELTWVGKYNEKIVEPRILIEDVSKSSGDPLSENMLIHGDNLIALQALQQDFSGKIKCIYIDPPYNTGSAFEYYDDNLEHSIWLSLMYKRVLPLKELLRDDGFFCCHIDDSESHYIKVLLDEIFGRSNYLTTLYIRVRYPDKTLKSDMDFHKEIEQVLVYRNGVDATPNFDHDDVGYEKFIYEIQEIRDGLTLHEHRKTVLREYCSDNDLDYVKPIVLIACKDTEHAKKIRTLIDNDSFLNGKYKGKVIEIHSKQTGEESEKNIRLLLSIESASNPVEIVLHVYKLKEGWDVNNLFTIIPLNAAKSDILAMQTIGCGLSLPFGEQTGNEDLDSLNIVAHDHYRELVDEIKSSDIFKYRDLDNTTVEPTETVDVSGVADEGQMNLFDLAFVDAEVKSFAEVQNPKTQLEIYQEYLKNFVAAQSKKKTEDTNQMSIFDYQPDIADGTGSGDSSEPEAQPVVTSKNGKQPFSKEEFVKAVTVYSANAISVPKILVQTTSEVKFNRLEVKRTIADFEVAMAKIERFDAVNQQLLSHVDAQILEVNDAMNTLACMFLDAISELSYDDADFVIDVVEQYLSQISGDEENKRRIIRRYATLIVSDIRKQVYEHMDRKTEDVHIVQKDLILFRKFVKNVKDEGKVKFDKPFSDKSNIKKYLFTGYKKSYYPANAFDSDTKRIFSIILEEAPDVIRWIKPPLNQLWLFWKAGQQYNPDFLVETYSGKFMVEVKAANEVTQEEVVSKAHEGIKWCEFASTADPDHKKWEYKQISDDNIHLGNTCKYTLGTANKVSEE